MTIIIYILLFILCSSQSNALLIERFCYFDGEYIVYSNDCTDIIDDNIVVVKNGNGSIYRCEITNYKRVLSGLDTITSETIKIKNISVDTILFYLQAKILSQVQVYDGLYLYNCYTDFFPQYLWVENAKNNLQIAVSEDTVFIGYPMLIDY